MFLILVTLVAVAAPSSHALNTNGPLDNSCKHSMEKAALVRPIRPDMTASTPATLHKLGDLPDVNMEIAVNRLVDGCSAPVTAIRNVMAARR